MFKFSKMARVVEPYAGLNDQETLKTLESILPSGEITRRHLKSSQTITKVADRSTHPIHISVLNEGFDLKKILMA